MTDEGKRYGRAALAASVFLAMAMPVAAQTEPGPAQPEPASTQVAPMQAEPAPVEAAAAPEPVEPAEPDAVQAGNVEARVPQSVLDAMQQMGFLATLDKDDDGDPHISSRISETHFQIYFYGCEENVECNSIQFVAGYDLDSDFGLGLMNDWNKENRWTKAYLDDEGDPIMEMDVFLGGGGVSRENFEEWLDLWRRLVEDFEVVIDY